MNDNNKKKMAICRSFEQPQVQLEAARRAAKKKKKKNDTNE